MVSYFNIFSNVIYLNWMTTDFQPLLKSSVSHDPSEIILFKKSVFIKTVIHFNIFVETAIYPPPPPPPPGFSDEYKIKNKYNLLKI